MQREPGRHRRQDGRRTEWWGGGGQGHSCDKKKEARMKNVPVGP